MCTLAEVRGRCPAAAGEALMQATMARTLGLAAGDTFDVTYSDTYLRRGAGAPGGVEAQRPRTVSYRIVGHLPGRRPGVAGRGSTCPGSPG